MVLFRLSTEFLDTTLTQTTVYPTQLLWAAINLIQYNSIPCFLVHDPVMQLLSIHISATGQSTPVLPPV
jgi:hypothetical protein